MTPDLMTDSIAELSESHLRIYVSALRGVLRLTRVELARKELEVCRAMLDAVSYRTKLADTALKEAEAANRGESP